MFIDKFGTYRMKQAMPTPPRQDPSWKTSVQLVTWRLHLAHNPLSISPLTVHSWQNCLLLLTCPSPCQKQQKIHRSELDLQLGKSPTLHNKKTSTILYKQNLVEMLNSHTVSVQLHQKTSESLPLQVSQHFRSNVARLVSCLATCHVYGTTLQFCNSRVPDPKDTFDDLTCPWYNCLGYRVSVVIYIRCHCSPELCLIRFCDLINGQPKNSYQY